MGCGFLTALIVAAHPDDEVLGAGIWMYRHADSDIHVVHITDGSPRDLTYARTHGLRSRKSYAAARRRELTEALRMVSVAPENRIQLDFADQEAYLHLPSLAEQLDTLIGKIRPDAVLSPAYEGGHPDHDSAAFAVAVVRKRRKSFRHWEFPLYHAGARGGIVKGEFLPQDEPRRESVIMLSWEERLLKRRMLACFSTQLDFLSNFKLRCERFRRAGACDFRKPPHAGALLYERWGWGISGEDWRKRAASAIKR